jgi:hypothetical protein
MVIQRKEENQMISRPVTKWIVTIILASIIIVAASIGGTWGTSYAKTADDLAKPVVTSIDPLKMPVTGTSSIMVIRGLNFGTMDNTRVRFYQWGGTVYELSPLFILPDLIIIEMPADMIDKPSKYDVIVIVYETTPTIPTLPNIPGESSEPITFSVYSFYYLPFSRR